MSISTEDRAQNGAAPPIETQLALRDQVGDAKTGLTERMHALEVAQATQAASMTGAHATQAAVQAGMMSAVMAGAVSFVVGAVLGSLLMRARR
jgi:hypothetical protein